MMQWKGKYLAFLFSANLPLITSQWQPRWEAMVINLDRRHDRLQHFAHAMNQSQPWLFNSGRLCRIAGRDGKELLDSQSIHKKHLRSKLPGHLSSSSEVPRHLKDEELIDGGWLTKEAVEMLHSKGTRWPHMTAGGAGLLLGHADAWRHVVDMDLDYGVIFEDDLTLFSPSFQPEVSRILSGNQEEDWDWLYLQLDVPSWLKNTECPYKKIIKSTEEPVLTGTIVPCTGAYVITRSGAEKLLASALPATDQLDSQLSNVPRMRRASLNPIVAQCDEKLTTEWGFVTYKDTDVQKGVPSKSEQDWANSVDSLYKFMKELSEPHKQVELPKVPPIVDCRS